jgi:hypothetical protein
LVYIETDTSTNSINNDAYLLYNLNAKPSLSNPLPSSFSWDYTTTSYDSNDGAIGLVYNS